MVPATSPDLLARLRARLAASDLEVPLLPDAASQVLAACFEEDVDARSVAARVELDPALAANVLRVANSAQYGGRQSIVTLAQAVARLGLRTLCDITLSVALHTRVFSAGARRAPMLAELWRHSALSALWAREIARARRRNVESAFLVGLLHDVGKPVVIEQAEGLADEAGIELGEEDLRALATELHAAAGARLLEAWRLPAWAAASARWHHAPDEARAGGEPFADEAATACLADLVAHWSAGGDDDPAALLGHPVLADLGVYAGELRELLGRRDDVLARVEAFL